MGEGLERRVQGIGSGERRDEIQSLPGNAQRFAAGGKDMQVRAGVQQRLCQLRASLNEMLAIVKNKQYPLRLKKVGEDHQRGAARLLDQPQR